MIWRDPMLCGCVWCVSRRMCRPDWMASGNFQIAFTSTTVSAVVVVLDARCRGVDVLCVSVCFAEGDWGIEISYNFTHRA